jgi:hypothetical protein
MINFTIPDKVRKILAFINQYYIWIMAIVTPVIIWLNWGATGMSGLLVEYQIFKSIILSGFDSSLVSTFPMWGYGWIMVITENKLVLLVFQSAMGLFALSYFVKVIERQKILSAMYVTALKSIMVVAVPWYCFHALRWANSISISLFLLSFAILIMALTDKRWVLFLLSGILFGLVLNFRSDYYLMPIGFAILILIFYKSTKKPLYMITWIAGIYMMLVPWGIYTTNVTGHFLLTSTNAGHVCFIGLGNNPNNKWGIVEHDTDPLMRSLVDEKFGKTTSTLEYKSNIFIKQEFINRVKSDPLEYGKKCLWSLKRYLLQGTYPGEFVNRESITNDNVQESQSSQKYSNGLVHNPITSIILMLIQLYSLVLSKLLVLLSMLVLPFTVYIAIKKRYLFFILMTSAICYQTAINVLCYQMSSYTSNMLLFFIINLLFGVQILRDRFKPVIS